MTVGIVESIISWFCSSSAHNKHSFREWQFNLAAYDASQESCKNKCETLECFLNAHARSLVQQNLIPFTKSTSSKVESFKVKVLSQDLDRDGLIYETTITCSSGAKLHWRESKDRGKILFVFTSSTSVGVYNIHSINENGSVLLKLISGAEMWRGASELTAVRRSDAASRYSWETFACLKNIDSIACEQEIVEGKVERPHYITWMNRWLHFGVYVDLRCLQLELDGLNSYASTQLLDERRKENEKRYRCLPAIDCNILNKESFEKARKKIDALRMESRLLHIGDKGWKTILYALKHRLMIVDCFQDTKSLELQLLLARLFINNRSIRRGPILLVTYSTIDLSNAMIKLMPYVKSSYLVSTDTYGLAGVTKENNVFQMLKTNDRRLVVDNRRTYSINQMRSNFRLTNDSSLAKDAKIASYLDERSDENILCPLLKNSDVIGTTFTYAARKHRLLERIEPQVSIIDAVEQLNDFEIVTSLISSLRNVCIFNKYGAPRRIESRRFDKVSTCKI